MVEDGTQEPRAEAALDLDRLATFLAAQAPELGAPLAIRQFRSGYSNLTYLLTTSVGELVLRRAPPGVAIAGAHDMAREFRLLAAVRPVFPRVPRGLVLGEDPAAIGSPFYVMEKLEGVILRGPEPAGVDLSPAAMRAASEALCDTLLALHAVDVTRGPLAAQGKPEGYLARQVEGWRGRWERARIEACAELDAAGTWLAGHQPRSGPPALLHNDFKYDNVVLSADLRQVVGVLDWEMAALGDPLADLGHTLALWTEPGDPWELRALQLGPTAQPGNLTRVEFLERYARTSGRDVSAMPFYLALGLFKFAVVVAQLFARFARGQSSDARYQGLAPVIAAFGRSALQVAERDRAEF